MSKAKVNKTIDDFDHSLIEKKWREKWINEKTFEPDLIHAENPYFNLMMFPYPSAEGLHVGNMYAFTGADVNARFQRMQGKSVFEPIGLDGFGIHSENFAIKIGRHPKEHAKISEENFYRQLSEIGNSFAWNYRLETYDPEYYKWTQWLFIKMFEAGLAYRDTAFVNWCPSCKTVLADEQVESGKCERCKNEVTKKEMSSWYFKITHYSEELLKNLDILSWPTKIKTAQRQWIGKKEGVIIHHKVKDLDIELDTFSAYPAWLFADTFIVIAPDHPIVEKLVENTKFENDVNAFIEESKKILNEDRQTDKYEKKGVFTGRYAINPFNGEEMPIWLANFALMDFGTGVIRCSAHDPRDYEFAKKYEIPLKEVVDRIDTNYPVNAHSNLGVLRNSVEFSDREINDKLVSDILDWIEEKKIGERSVNYHLRDWLISRQRYWGSPIPMVYCESCNKWHPVPLNELPVVLPDIDDFKPKGDGFSPLSNASDDWKYTKCPVCGGKAKRELDVSDTFLDSSWYFLAYPNLFSDEYKNAIEQEDKQSKNSTASPFNKLITEKWFPVSAYIGGAEHAVLHLLYARFVWMALQDMNFLDKNLGREPFPFLFGHGLIIKDGSKMSKSKGNVINPDDYIKKYGADTLRLYLLFLGPYSDGGDFRDSGIEGMQKFVKRVWKIIIENLQNDNKAINREIDIKMHQTIKKTYIEMQEFRFNTTIAAIMEYVNTIQKNGNPTKDQIEVLLKLIAPFAPFMAEEAWEKLGNKESIHLSGYPKFDESKLVEDNVTIAVSINGKLRSIILVSKDKSEDEAYIKDLALKEDNVIKHLDQKEIKKVIFVKGKIINLII